LRLACLSDSSSSYCSLPTTLCCTQLIVMAQAGSGQAPGLSQKLDSNPPHRPPASERAESSLNPILSSARAAEAVTPGIHPSTYTAQSPPEESSTQSYFSKSDQPLSTELETSAQSPSQAAAGANSGDEILRRMSLAIMGRRESLSEIRGKNPELSLSGNIISATFNIPHSFKYRKGADWVRLSRWSLLAAAWWF
jgi:trehalose 6-phosphate synthase/phosphatase